MPTNGPTVHCSAFVVYLILVPWEDRKMFRIKLALLIGGGVLAFFGIQEVLVSYGNDSVMGTRCILS